MKTKMQKYEWRATAPNIQTFKVLKTLKVYNSPVRLFVLRLLCSSLIPLYLIPYSSHAQNAKTDSLLLLLKKDKEDTNKVNHLYQLTRECELTGDYEKGLNYGNESLQLARKLNFKKGIANAYNNSANIFRYQANYLQALDYYLKALKIDEELKNKKAIAMRLGNIGNVYRNQSDYAKALDYYFRALKMKEEFGNKLGVAITLGNIGIVYDEEATIVSPDSIAERNRLYTKALDYYFRALKIDEELGNKHEIANALGNIGIVYREQATNNKSQFTRDSLYAKSLDYYSMALKTDEELGDKNGMAADLGNIGSLYTKKGQETRNEEQKKKFFTDAEKYLQDALKLCREIESQDYERIFEESLSELYSHLPTPNYKLSLEHYKKGMALKDTIFSQENKKQLVRKEMNYEFEKQQAAQKAEQEKKDAVAEAESRKQKIIRNSIAGGLCGVLVFFLIVYRQRNRIAKEKKRSDELLLNILPAETAEELKLTGHAEPKQFDMVTVLFTDFKGFTQIAEKLSAKELVSELDFLFKKFDEIISKYPIEKIKTIGDSYMCAGGLPVANTTNAMDVTLAAVQIQQFMEEHNQQQTTNNKPAFQIRIGIHTGPIVAGIVGIKKFSYDIWGDTVNTASRMESSGEAGKVNVSGSTYELVKDKFNCIYRGEIEAKHKGKIKMYFVERA
ncbi:MAG: tetratricopeptide repeat protein [Bacteroidetes bacterium]|nr:tetratricopeptide repeat protein [Bacteroidota bacterium]